MKTWRRGWFGEKGVCPWPLHGKRRARSYFRLSSPILSHILRTSAEKKNGARPTNILFSSSLSSTEKCISPLIISTCFLSLFPFSTTPNKVLGSILEVKGLRRNWEERNEELKIILQNLPLVHFFSCTKLEGFKWFWCFLLKNKSHTKYESIIPFSTFLLKAFLSLPISNSQTIPSVLIQFKT